MTDAQDVQVQYKDDQNLNARIALHARFSTNPYGWQRWVFDTLERAGLPEYAQVLELGCGPGDLWESNRARIPAGWALTLTDASDGMVEAAQEKLGELPTAPAFRTVDAQSIPFAGGTFDAVVANHMLYHVPDRQQALNEVRRVLKPGGMLFATTVGEGHMRELWNLVEPFVPDIHDRTQGVSSRAFSLQSGGEQLVRVFANVARYDYEDGLEVTDVQPVIAYLRSTTVLMHCTLEPSQWATIRRIVAAHIETKGAFHITKASGIFIAS